MMHFFCRCLPSAKRHQLFLEKGCAHYEIKKKREDLLTVRILSEDFKILVMEDSWGHMLHLAVSLSLGYITSGIKSNLDGVLCF